MSLLEYLLNYCWNESCSFTKNKKHSTMSVFKILYLIFIKTREVRTYTLLPHLIRILNIFGRFPALLFFQKKFQRILISYTITKDGEEKITCKIRKKKQREKNVQVQFRGEKWRFWQTRIHVGAIFLSKAFWLIGRIMAGGWRCDICEFISGATHQIWINMAFFCFCMALFKKFFIWFISNRHKIGGGRRFQDRIFLIH